MSEWSKTYWSGGKLHVEPIDDPYLPAPSPSPVVEVSEEMVRAALNTFLDDYTPGNGMAAMEAALIAALRVR